jgi:hypothetical protein
MGTQEEEAKALAELERVRTENAIREMQRQEELRKLQEQQNQNKMVADPEPVVANWPDDGFQAAAPGRLDGVKGALGIGAAGDAALASRLLNDGRPPAADAVAGRPGAEGGGVKERLGAALGAGIAKPAVER